MLQIILTHKNITMSSFRVIPLPLPPVKTPRCVPGSLCRIIYFELLKSHRYCFKTSRQAVHCQPAGTRQRIKDQQRTEKGSTQRGQQENRPDVLFLVLGVKKKEGSLPVVNSRLALTSSRKSVNVLLSCSCLDFSWLFLLGSACGETFFKIWVTFLNTATCSRTR
jgi:hypothetical protein